MQKVKVTLMVQKVIYKEKPSDRMLDDTLREFREQGWRVSVISTDYIPPGYRLIDTRENEVDWWGERYDGGKGQQVINLDHKEQVEFETDLETG